MTGRRVRAVCGVLGLGALGALGACQLTGVDEPSAIQPPRVLWRVSIPTLGPPALDATTVYFATRYHSVVAIDRASGHLRWTGYCCVGGDWGSTRRTPMRAADVIVFGDDDIVAFDVATGARRWLFDRVGGVYTRSGMFPFQTDGTRIIAGSAFGAAFGLDAATGHVVWRTDLMPGTDRQVRVHAVRDNMAFLTIRYDGPFYQGRVFALNATTGAVVWSYEMGRVALLGDVVVAPAGSSAGLLLLGFDSGKIAALDISSGAERWTIPGPSLTGGSGRRMVVVGTMLIATASGTTTTPDFIAAYDLDTGVERWTTESEQGSASSYYGMVSTDGSTVYIVFANGALGAYELSTGQRLWFRRPPGGFFFGSPIISHDTLFLAGSEAAYAIAR